MVNYLDVTRIGDRKTTDAPRYGITVDGYTIRSGAPTHRMIKVDGGPWRRVMVWCFSNCSTLFVRIDGNPFILTEMP